MTPELELLLQGLPPLRTLGPEALKELEGAIRRRTAAKGEYLFHQGEGPPANVYYLISASAEILLGPPKDERPVSVSRPGQLLGWVTMAATDLFPVSARVVEPGDVLQISAQTLRALIGREPTVGMVLASEMARYLKDLFHGLRVEVALPSGNRIETFPFRTRLRTVMAGPVVTLPPDAQARVAARTMKRSQVGSVIVSDGEWLHGIVTEQDLVRRVFAEARDPDSVPLEEVMSAPVASLGPDDYIFEALSIMRRRNVHHVAVEEDGQLVGIVSMSAILGLATSGPFELVERIGRADTVEALAEAHAVSRLMCADLLDEGVPAEEVSQLLSRINRDLHCRVLETSIGALEAEGWGKPPVEFCFILMGSHGRSENHFHTDQDHGMILTDYPVGDWGRVEPYFRELGTRVSEGLARVGFRLCRGQVMSSNPVWRKPVREWKAQIRGWYADPSSKAVRYSTLFYDFEPVWGDASLARDLRAFITGGIQRNFQLLQSLYAEASRHRVPLTLFRNFVTERSGPHKGQMNLKRSGYLFVVECSRIMALRHGVTRTGTIERLQALSEKGAIAAEEAEFVQTAYKTLLHFLLTTQAAKLRGGEAVDNYLNPRALPIQERYVLRHALEATSRLQSIVHASFGDIFF